MLRSEANRKIIIEKAAGMFNERGIAGTPVDDILKVTNLSKSSFYGIFPGKAELSYATVDYMLGRIVDARNAAIAQGDTPKDKILSFMKFVKNPISSIIDGGCPVINLAVESDDTNPIIKQKVRTMIEYSIKIFSTILQEGIDCGQLSDKLNPEEFAQRLFISIEGANAICRVLGSIKPMQTILKGFKTELDFYSLQ
ncbi:TetR/AcrR family transcriptional regulator [Mucilaginibacter sp. RCC_168]|uniref:TetR/AcrR family transcriptional regulator n=1 Tax=Mucilaginibacter sp. RCC_168 TaxID=3239221 RepID=UPI003524B8C6